MVLLIAIGLPMATLASTPIVGLYTEGTFHDDGSWSFNPIGLSTPRVLASSAVRHPHEINVWLNRETYLSWMVEETFEIFLDGESVHWTVASPSYNIHLLADTNSELTILTHEIAPDRVLSEGFRFGGARVQRIPAHRGWTQLSPGNFILGDVTPVELLYVEEVTEPINLTLTGDALYLIEIWGGEATLSGWRSVRTIPIAVGAGPFATTPRWTIFIAPVAALIVVAFLLVWRRRRLR